MKLSVAWVRGLEVKESEKSELDRIRRRKDGRREKELWKEKVRKQLQALGVKATSSFFEPLVKGIDWRSQNYFTEQFILVVKHCNGEAVLAKRSIHARLGKYEGMAL